MTKLLIAGHSARFHIGAMFYHSAKSAGIEVQLLDGLKASEGNWLLTRINRRFRDRRPARMGAFNRELIEIAVTERPDVLLVTGMLPPDRVTLQSLHDMGIRCINFLTDDPWNPAHTASWVLDALPMYDIVFSPRRANIPDLERLGCIAQYLPFAYDPALHFRELCPLVQADSYECDVLFYGGADQDRLPYITSLIDAGLDVHLYGGYWNRYAKTRPYWKGMANAQTLRWAVSSAKVTLCLVRRANRDGHVMRTFEIPAMGGCMLTEDTEEHRAIFGEDGERILYFLDRDHMLEQLVRLLQDNALQNRLRWEVHHHIMTGQHTYGDRLLHALQSTDRL